jgi:hypothetical protein
MTEDATRAVEAALDVPRLVALGTAGATLESYRFPEASPVGDDHQVA